MTTDAATPPRTLADAASAAAAASDRPRHASNPRGLIWQPRFLGIVAILDALVLLGTGLSTHLATAGRPSLATVAVIVAGTVLAIALMQRAWVYTVNALANVVRQTGQIAVSLVAAFAGLMAMAFLLDAGVARPWLVGWLSFALLGLLALRMLTARLVRRWSREGRLVRRAVIVGGGRAAAELIDALGRGADSGVEILGVFDDRCDERSPAFHGTYEKLGSFESLVAFCRTARIDLLIVTLPLSAEDRLMALLKQLWVLPVDIRLSAHTSKLRLRPRAYTYIGGIPFLSLFDKPLSDWNAFLKAVEDRVLGWAILVLLAPVMAAVALAVRLDSRGPVLFRQKRYGFNNELIEVLKFRSMYADAADAGAARLVTKGDARVTRVGRVIRRTSLDELPQLWNVVRGELSLVGPRPHALQAKSEDRLYDEVVDGYFARHKIKPGITGWAQINGWRGETDRIEKIEQRVAHDIAYIDNWSLWFDLYIVALTPFALLKTENAY